MNKLIIFQEFSQICKIASGKDDKCPISEYEHDIESFRTCVEKWLASMDSFNFISESAEARWTLYNICKFNVSFKFEINEETGAPELTNIFTERFPTYTYFESLYE